MQLIDGTNEEGLACGNDLGCKRRSGGTPPNLRFVFSGLLLSLLAVTTALAGLVPSFTKTFLPDTIGPGGVSTLKFDITNSDPINPASDMAFTDNLPAGVTIASPANLTNTCGGTVTATSGGGTISLTGGMLGVSPNNQCSITVDVTSSTVATHMNVSGDLTSMPNGNSGAAVDDLIVATDRPGFTKTFFPSTVPLGTRSTLTFTIDNTANAAPAASLDFTDVLPTGLIIASPANASTDCGSPGALIMLTAAPGTSVITLDVDGSAAAGFEALAAGATCTVTVDVVSTGAGILGNTSEELISTATALGQPRSSGKASAVLNVTVGTISLVKEFTDDPVIAGGTVNLQFRITNLDRDFSATGITFTDDLNMALSSLMATGTPLADPCGSGSSLTGTSTLTLSDGILGPGASCTFDVAVLVPAAALTGNYTNTTGAISADVDGSPVMGNSASDVLFVQPAPILTKTFTDDPVVAGDTVTLEFTIVNPSPTSPASDIEFSDNLTAVVAGLTTTMLPVMPCGMGSSLTETTVGGEQVLILTGGDLEIASGSCTFQVTLQVPAGTANGTYPNTTSPITANVDDITATGNPASDDLVVVAAPSLRKEFTDDPVLPGDTVTLEFTLSHDVDASTDATGITFSDDLNAALANLMAIGLPANDICGMGSSISGTTNLTFMGGTLSPGASCTFSVTLQVPDPAAPGDHTNTTSSVSAVVAGITASSPPAEDDLTIASLLFTKQFTDDPVVPGGMVTLEFTIDNVGPDDATGITFTDNLSDVFSGLAATGLPLGDPCGMGSSLTGFSGDTFLLFTGGSVVAGDMCIFSVTLQVPGGASDGTFNNVTSNLTATVGGSPLVIDPAADPLTVDSNLLQLTKEFTDDPVAPGGSVNLRFTLDNLDATNGASNIAFTDDLGDALAGLVPTGLPVSGCGGMASLIMPDTIDFAGGSLTPGGSCFFDVSVSVPTGVALGTVATNTTSSVTGTINSLAVTGGPASDDLLIDFVTFTKAFDGPTGAGGNPVLTFTITNLDIENPVIGLGFMDNLNATLMGLEATGLPMAACGGTLSGTSTISLSGGSLAAGAMCSFDVMLQVPTNAAAGDYLNTTTNLTSSGVPVANPASATLEIEPPPLFAKAFSPAFIGVGFASVLTFSIDNTASTIAATNLDFTDNLPAGIVLAGTPNASTTCMGGSFNAVGGSSVFAYTGGTVPAGMSCLVQVTVVGTAAGSLVNTSGDLTSSLGNSGTASDTLTVNPQPLFSKAFSPNPIDPGETSTLIFIIDNTGSTVNATSLNFSDTLPTNVIIATPSNAIVTCMGGMLTAPDGGSTISYTGGTALAGASCTVSVDVTSDVPGTHANTSGDLTSSLGNSGTASDDLVVNDFVPLGFSKAFSPTPIAPGATSTLTFTIDNSVNQIAIGNIGFSDTLPTDVVIATPSSAATTCTGGTLTAPDGGSTISYMGGMVSGSSNCSVSVDVTSAVPGTYTNTSGDLTSDAGNSGTATANLTVSDFGVLVFNKSFSPNPIDPGDTSTLTFNIDNTTNLAAVGNLDFSDTLPANVVIATPSNAATTCTGGTLTAPDGGSTISYTGGTVAASSSCTVTVNVTSDVPGTHTNLSGDLTSDAGNSGTATANLTVNPFPLVDLRINKTPDVQTVTTGGIATFTIALRNDGDVDITNIAVSDPLTPSCDRAAGSLPNLAPNDSTSYTCQTGSLTAGFVNVATAIGLADGEPIQGSDAAQVNVVAPDLTIAKTPDTQSVDPGQTATFTITVMNQGDSTLTNIVVDDPFTPDCERAAGSLMDLAPGGMLSYTCDTEPLFADLTNVATASADGVGPQSDSAFVDVIAPIEILKEPNEQQISAGTSASFTITINNPSMETLSSIVVLDASTPDCARTLGQIADIPAGGFTSYGCVTGPLFLDLINVATVMAQDSMANLLSDSDTAFVDVVNDVIDITKTADQDTVPAGSTATFTIQITNLGMDLLFNLQVSDPLTPSCERAVGDLPDLAPGESTSYTCETAPLFADLINVATVTAEFGMGGASVASAAPTGGSITVQAVATATVLIISPDLSVTKTAASGAVGMGETVEFTITITNTGSQTLTDLEVDDPLSPDCNRAVGSLPDLLPGESTSYTCTSLPLVADLVNIATATAQRAVGDAVMASASDTVMIPGGDLMPIENIPTLSDLGLLIQLLLLAGAGFLLLRRLSG